MKKLFLLASLFSLVVHADYTTGKRITASDIIQGTKSVENFIKDSPPKSGVTKGWSCYADAAGTRPVDGTGGSPNVTWTATSTSPVKGPGAFVFTKGGSANRQGQGCSYTFSVDVADRAKVLDIEAEYLVGSGTFVPGTSSTNSDVIVYIYDVTNSTLIEPSSIKLLSNNTTLSDTFRASFQTSATGSSYRLIFHVSTTSTADYTLKFGDISVAKSKYSYGTPITDWSAQETTSGTHVSNVTYNRKWRREGDSIRERIQITYTGATTSSALQVNTKYTIDVSKLNGGALNNTESLGVCALTDVSTGFRYVGSVAVGSAATQIRCGGDAAATGNWSDTNPVTIASGDYIEIDVLYPATGLSSSVQMSDRTDTRVVSFVGTVPTQSLTANVTDISATTEKDSHGAWSGTVYTVPVSGDYKISSFIYSAATAFNSKVYVNSSFTRYIGYHAASFGGGGTVILPNLKTGDTISVRSNTTATIASDAGQTISISRISGPSAIAASELVTAKFTTDTARTTNNTTPTIVYEDEIWDSHSAYNNSTGEFTCPISGRYIASGGYALSGVAGTVGHANILRIFKNGSIDTDLAANVVQTTTSIVNRSYGSAGFSCVYGDIITFRFYSDTANTLNSGAAGVSNHITLNRVGF